jgi:uncharacterized protein (DUF58 family)
MFSRLSSLLGIGAPKISPVVVPAPKDAMEAHRRLRRVEIVASKLVQEVFAGKYESLFKGQGVEFSDIQEYFPGDDVRSIDWNVTARLGRPFVKRNEEERELQVILALDSSASMLFGSGARTKRDVASELAAILAFSALRNGDKVGLIRFSGEIEHVIPAHKGRKHVMRILGEILGSTPQQGSSNLAAALDGINRIYKRRALVFLLSDFLADGYEPALKRTQKRHDLSAFRLYDPREEEFPAVGRIRLRDLETGRNVLVNASSEFASEYRERRLRARAQLRKTFDAAQVDWTEFSTNEDAVPVLSRFFATKKGRRKRRAAGQ